LVTLTHSVLHSHSLVEGGQVKEDGESQSVHPIAEAVHRHAGMNIMSPLQRHNSHE